MLICLKQHSDQSLVHLFQNGHERAIEELINRYKSSIYTSIYIIIKDRFVAEDIFQDTFLKIVNNIRVGKYAEQGKFLPWAIRIARNLSIDYFRKIKQQKQINITFPNGHDIFSILPFSTDENAETKISNHETINYLEHLINDLPLEQREVLVMRIYANMSYKQISTITNVSINTALGRMRYALINLRGKLTKHQQKIMMQ